MTDELVPASPDLTPTPTTQEMIALVADSWPVTRDEIEELAALRDSLPELPDVPDKDSLGEWKAAKARCVTARTTIEGHRKRQKASALEFGQAVDSQAKALRGAVEAVEAPIAAGLQRVKDAAEARRKAAQEEQQRRIQARMRRLGELGSSVPSEAVAAMSEEDWQALEASEARTAEQRRAAELRAQAEREAELEAERERQRAAEAEREEQRRQEAAARAEAERELAEERKAREALEAEARKLRGDEARRLEEERVEAERKRQQEERLAQAARDRELAPLRGEYRAALRSMRETVESLPHVPGTDWKAHVLDLWDDFAAEVDALVAPVEVEGE